MKIVITGPKSCGKSTVGAEVAEKLNLDFYETDQLFEQIYAEKHGEKLSFYDIFQKVGEATFREYEAHAAAQAAELDWCLVSLGGSTLLNPDTRKLLMQDAVVVLLTADSHLLWERLTAIGKSKYLNQPNAEEHFKTHVDGVVEKMTPYANIVMDVSDGKNIADKLIEKITDYMAVLSHSANTYGDIIRVTTFGESHGPALGVVMDGVKPGIELNEEDIQKELNRRKPGQSAISTPRSEADKIHILSGVFEGKTTGCPIAMVLYNVDHDSTKYDIIKHLFRPGHADFTFWKKYGIRDHKGGGRSSGRETAARVAGGAVAKKLLSEKGVTLIASSIEIANIQAQTYDASVIEQNPVRCGDRQAAEKMQQAILDAKSKGDSVGGIVELRISGLPAGLGDPVFGKIDARLAGALCSLGAVKGLEFGDGFQSARLNGSQFNDAMKDGQFVTNHAGGILGGITTGEELIIRLAIRPTPSISIEQQTCDLNGKNQSILIEGRHDPCIVPRIIPVVESMAALVLLDAWQIQNRLHCEKQTSE